MIADDYHRVLVRVRRRPRRRCTASRATRSPTCSAGLVRAMDAAEAARARASEPHAACRSVTASSLSTASSVLDLSLQRRVLLARLDDLLRVALPLGCRIRLRPHAHDRARRLDDAGRHRPARRHLRIAPEVEPARVARREVHAAVAARACRTGRASTRCAARDPPRDRRTASTARSRPSTDPRP